MKRHYALTFLLCAVLSACASLGVTEPKSLSDRLAYGYGTYTAVVSSAANAVSAGDITKDDGAEVLKLTDQARSILDGARATVDTDPAGASRKAELAIAVLAQAQNYLRSHR